MKHKSQSLKHVVMDCGMEDGVKDNNDEASTDQTDEMNLCEMCEFEEFFADLYSSNTEATCSLLH